MAGSSNQSESESDFKFFHSYFHLPIHINWVRLKCALFDIRILLILDRSLHANILRQTQAARLPCQFEHKGARACIHATSRRDGLRATIPSYDHSKTLYIKDPWIWVVSSVTSRIDCEWKMYCSTSSVNNPCLININIFLILSQIRYWRTEMNQVFDLSQISFWHIKNDIDIALEIILKSYSDKQKRLCFWLVSNLFLTNISNIILRIFLKSDSDKQTTKIVILIYLKSVFENIDNINIVLQFCLKSVSDKQKPSLSRIVHRPTHRQAWKVHIII